jgi:SAM-dependent methyltransferase
MKHVSMKLGAERIAVPLPDRTEVLAMATPEPLADPAAAVAAALEHSSGAPGLDRLIRQKLAAKPDLRAAVVVSDNTRPVPYRGEAGILWPILRNLLDRGVAAERIVVIVANGTHRSLNPDELRAMLDPRVFEAGIPVVNHDCFDRESLEYLGETRRGSRIYINREYLRADLKILTGLVESHFMAGFSGGRKSVCPGLIGEESTYVFHSAPMLASPLACDLSLAGNPCHEEALEVARKAGADYIVNVTLDHQFRLTGVFAGELEQAHLRAAEQVRKYVAIPVAREYDLVVTHAGFVGINHYQAAKAGVAASRILKPGGSLILIADNCDTDPVGSARYRTVLHLLRQIGAERFNRLILSPDWTFIPEQWQVQMWTKLLAKIPPEHFIYYSPQLTAADYEHLPGTDGNLSLPEAERYRGDPAAAARVVELAVAHQLRAAERAGREPLSIAYLADGPYGIPVLE